MSASAHTEQSPIPAPAEEWHSTLDTSFTGDLRDSARQQRFVRSGTASAAPRTARISDDHRAMIAELARMSDRLVESREQLAVTTARASELERQLATANTALMASRVLVTEAQSLARDCAENLAAAEARADTLEDALDRAIHASFWTRRRWRRELRDAQTAR